MEVAAEVQAQDESIGHVHGGAGGKSGAFGSRVNVRSGWHIATCASQVLFFLPLPQPPESDLSIVARVILQN